MTNNNLNINNSTTLPPPLSTEEEADIISRLDGDPSLKNILIERNLRLVLHIVKRFENSGAQIEDLISIGTIGLIKVVNTFKTDKKIKLAAYASRCIENEIMIYMRSAAANKPE